MPVEQVDLFTPAPCPACGKEPRPHWLPNYPGAPWVMDHFALCRVDQHYGASRDAVVIEWNEWTASRPKEEQN